MSTLGDTGQPGLDAAATTGGVLGRRAATLGGRVVEEIHYCTATNTITTVDYRPTLTGGQEVVHVQEAGRPPEQTGDADG